MRHFLPLLAFLLLPVVSQAQTKPEKVVPLESRSEARALVQQLLHEGKIMAPGEAKRGMKGYALSVFQGTKIEKFGVEVLGVLEKVQGGGDLVLIKVTDGPVVERQSGIIQGMSGSPVYLNGKLLGAIAIGFGFPKEPIGGVTPITEMIATALPDNGPKVPPVKLSQLKLPQSEVFRPRTALTIQNRRIARLEVTRDRSLAAFSGPSDAATMRMRPATQLLLLSGVSSSSMGMWKAMFEPYGISPVMGGGTMGGGAMGNRQAFGMPSKKSGVSANLAPGAAIGVQLASGDVDATGVGTVTYRFGNRVLAFGHPMFGLGAVSMPMTTAYVHDLFPAYDISFKLASPIQSVGELQQDTNFAIGGTVGRRAETIPLRIQVRDAAKKINKNFNVRLFKDPLFTPQLAQGIAVEALQSTLGLDSDKTVRVVFTMGLKNGTAIRRSNTVYAADQVVAGALGEMLDALSITQSNPYEKGNITSIDLSAEVIQSRKTARIRRIYADKNRVKAGENVQISVVLEPTGQPDEEITRHFTVRVPDDAPNGVLRVAASSAADYFGAKMRVGGEPPRPGNFKELLTAYAQIGANDELLLQVSTPRRFLLIDRKRVSNPPPTWNRLIGGSLSSSVGIFNETQEQREKSEWVLSGMESLSVPVESNRSSDRNRPDTPAGDDSASTSTATASSDTGDATTPDSTSDDTTTTELYVGVPASRDELTMAPDFQPRAARLMRILMQIPVPRPTPPVDDRIKLDPTPTPVAPAVPSATPSAAPTATPTPSPTPDASASNIARPPGRWVQKTSADFGRGTFDGTVVSDDGTIRVGPKNQRLASSAEPVAWSVAVDGKGVIYLGTGHSARLLKIENGVASVLYQGPEVAISALTLDKAGNLYAGASPGGTIYRFAPDGTRSVFMETDQTFVHALSFDAAGNLLVATGGQSAEIFRVPTTGASVLLNAKPLAVLPQKHARSLSVAGDAIYVGTGDAAVLYQIDGQGNATALYQATGATTSTAPTIGSDAGVPPAPMPVNGDGTPNSPTVSILSGGGGLIGGDGQNRSNEVLAVAATANNVYFGTANSGSIFRWNAQSGVQEFFKTPGRSIYALRLIGGALWAGTGENGEVWRVSNLDGDPTGSRVLDATQPQVLALTDSNNIVYAATGNNAAVYQIGGMGADTFVSNVFDAGQIVRFGTLQAIAQGATFEFHTGNTIEPDATWSAWQSVTSGSNVLSTLARYAQYRVKLADGGSVSRLEIVYRAPNRAPRVTWTTPAGGEAFSAKKTLTWSATDPDKDTLRYSLELIGADGKSQKVDLTSATASSQEVDTKKYSDGTYTAKITASDAARNPDDPRSDTATSLPFVIDNTLPIIAAPTIQRDGATWKLTFAASDALSALSGAEWRTVSSDPKAKAADWQAIASSDGLFDSRTETGMATLDPTVAMAPFKSGDQIEIRLRDAAGNAATAKVTLP